MKKQRINWRLLWARFGRWVDRQEEYPDWWGKKGQRVKIQQMVEAELDK